MDYLLVHTGDIGGPTSLHPPTPLKAAALLVRRKLVETALELMMTRDLVNRAVSNEGFLYTAGESAAPFLEGLEAEYLTDLKARADWLVEHLGDLSDFAFRALMRRFFDQWVEEFQGLEKSLGAES
jgi:hypothetical protein